MVGQQAPIPGCGKPLQPEDGWYRWKDDAPWRKRHSANRKNMWCGRRQKSDAVIPEDTSEYSTWICDDCAVKLGIVW